ncbi:MAG: hypothetical protein GF331_16530 [Chitinivibrionales bacterium]|nr:hypothetical protein [Chitinivibrionales bacterium]
MTKHRALHMLSVAATATGTVLLVPCGIVMFAGLLGATGLMPGWSPLDGADYVPPLFLLLFALPAAALLAAGGRKAVGAALTVATTVYFILLGDISLLSVGHRGMSRDAAADELERFSVMALNVRYYSYGVARVTDCIGKARPHVALLSENVLSETQRDSLCRRLPEYSFIMGRQESTALLSRLPVTEWREVELPSYQASLRGRNTIEAVERRGVHRAFVHAVVDYRGTPVNVISIRFIAGRARDKTLAARYAWGRYLLRIQKEEVAFFKQYIAGLNGPVVFGGDLNATPSSRPVRTLSAIAQDAYLSRHLFGGFTFRTELPTIRLDYIYHTAELSTVDARILPDEVSDHFPVYAELSLQPTATQFAGVVSGD